MSIIGEYRSELEALSLQKVLLEALDSKNKDVIAFCKKTILPLYNSALEDSFNPKLFESEEYQKIKESYV